MQTVPSAQPPQSSTVPAGGVTGGGAQATLHTVAAGHAASHGIPPRPPEPPKPAPVGLGKQPGTQNPPTQVSLGPQTTAPQVVVPSQRAPPSPTPPLPPPAPSTSGSGTHAA
jgi:hypothetical protein